MGAWILDSKAVSLGKITDTSYFGPTSGELITGGACFDCFEVLALKMCGLVARHSAGEHVVKRIG